MESFQRTDVLGLVDQREVAVGAKQRHFLGDRLRNSSRNVLRRSVDRIGGHHPVCGVLAAGDGDQARCGHCDRVLPRQRRRVLALPRQQRPQPAGYPYWVEVDTDANGFNDAVWLTTLCQVLKLNINESPFWGNYGIPAQQAIVQQVFPNFYVERTQQQFSQYFASLIISNDTAANVEGQPVPAYNVFVVTNYGAKKFAQVSQ